MAAVGFIGLGVMGRPMAEHLIRAGHEVTVHNRSQEPVRALQAAGAKAGRSPADVAAGAEVVITMLPDSPDSRPWCSATTASCRPRARGCC
jgi:3-hydroxyisobutyrate dehydrogenase-like beta-hydroxyacid dehydrogenase